MAQCPNLGQNMVVNGNFSAGNTGFSTGSSYMYVPNSTFVNNELQPEGRYSISDNPNTLHPAFWCPCTTAAALNPTCCNCTPGERVCTPGDSTMIINAVSNPPDTVWRQTIHGLIVGQFYSFSVEVDNAIPGSCGPGIIDPFIRVHVNGTPLSVNLPLPECPDAPRPMVCGFQANRTTISLSIFNLAPGAVGNDFMIDNIQLRRCLTPGVVLSGCNILPPPLAVVGLKISGQSLPEGNRLAWSTLREYGSLNFMLQRAYASNGELQEWVNIANLPAQGGANMGANYSFLDRTRSATATAVYRVAEWDADGNEQYSDLIELEPTALAAAQCAAPQAGLLQVWNPSANTLEIQVLDVQGRMLVSFVQMPGAENQLEMQPGVYFVRSGEWVQKVVVR